MRNGPHFRQSLLTEKTRLAEGREKLKAQHVRGSPGVQLSARLAALADSILLGLYEAALKDLGQDAPDGLRQQIALVALGGYGRRALAPFSDIDLMILHLPAARGAVAGLAKRLMQDIFDVGLELGFSVRTPADATQLAKSDPTIYTSLLESRLLAGNDSVYQQFKTRLAKLVQRRTNGLLQGLIAARREEQVQYGETVYLLEPNVKRSRGGLRDIHLIRWIGFTKYGVADPDQLQLRGVLSKHDQRILRDASEFLIRVRNEMHFCNGKAHDVLDRTEQIRLAERFGFSGNDVLLPVEQFMQEYFRYTSRVRYLASRFVEVAWPSNAMAKILAPVFSHAIGSDYRVGPGGIMATQNGLDKLKTDLREVLRLTDLANLYDKRIAHVTWAAIYRASPKYSSEISDEVAERFLSLLSRPARLGELLRRLHELGVLEKIIPAFGHARCLLQFNDYHKYTVDEHCIRAVESATEFASDTGALGQAYRRIKRKEVLHLALLVHDLGKGLPGDHSDVGATIASDIAERLRFSESECQLVGFLVQKHLVMSHLAFRRDTGDESVVIRFAVELGSPEVLRMLYVLTCADLSSVGPGVLNSWKVEVLTNLYHRTMWHLAGDFSADSDRRLRDKREEVLGCLAPNEPPDSLKEQVDALPTGYLIEESAERIAKVLTRLVENRTGPARIWGTYLPESQTIEYWVAVDEHLAPGLFYRLTGAFSSQGLAILSAQLNNTSDGLVLDRFVVQDLDYSGEPPEQRIDQVCRTVEAAIQSTDPPKFREVWGREESDQRYLFSPLPSRVRFDNNTVEAYTILDVFTFDRQGLLYTIARTLFELKLSIAFAKIGTYLDQVVDVFYVTDEEGKKIEEEGRLESIRQRLLEAIDRLTEESGSE